MIKNSVFDLLGNLPKSRTISKKKKGRKVRTQLSQEFDEEEKRLRGLKEDLKKQVMELDEKLWLLKKKKKNKIREGEKMKFKKFLSTLLLLALSLTTFAKGIDVGMPVAVTVTGNAPTIDVLDVGLYSGSTEIVRSNNYGFEGETLWLVVLVEDLDGRTDIQKVDVHINGLTQAGCNRMAEYGSNGYYYDCFYVIETPETAHGNSNITVFAIDKSGLTAETEPVNYFLNPEIALGIDGILDFGSGTAGSDVEKTITVFNAGEDGVTLRLMISGRDLYSDSPGVCPSSNVLAITNMDFEASFDGVTNSGTLGYEPQELISADIGVGQSVSITFTLHIPVPCSGTFEAGEGIMFSAEAI